MIMSDYDRIEKAIAYLVERVGDQPSLEDVAAHVHLSPFHFQRMFCQWAGTTPKRFLQVLTLERGKRLMEQQRQENQQDRENPHGQKQQSHSLLDVSHAIGLSGSSRLHDHFVQIEAVTPGEHKGKGRDVRIEYGVHDTPFGEMFVAVTQRGICRAGFVDFATVDEQLSDLRKPWPLAILARNEASTRPVVDAMFGETETTRRGPLSLHVAGTNFQIAVWRALLQIPEGAVVSYSRLARTLGCPRAARAVGSAIGANPIAFLIPCHRVIQQSGALGGYRWGVARKRVIQAWERLRPSPSTPGVHRGPACQVNNNLAPETSRISVSIRRRLLSDR